jgi:GxxExxY protein
MDAASLEPRDPDHRRPEVGGELTGRIIAGAISVHRTLGPGLLESVYRKCLAWELDHAGLRFRQEVEVPLRYRGVLIQSAYRADMIVEDTVLLELKAIDRVLAVHEAQLRTYLRLGGWPVGLLFNFNSIRLKDGLRRCIP